MTDTDVVDLATLPRDGVTRRVLERWQVMGGGLPLTARQLDMMRAYMTVELSCWRGLMLVRLAGWTLALALVALLVGAGWLATVGHAPWLDTVMHGAAVAALLALVGLAVAWQWQRRLERRIEALRGRWGHR